ncbi:MAG: hypothetical protein JWN59_1768, partial [Sphingomonas bacterium]|nr:hypothetical protein [Sphingomonas bacterium]
PAGCEKDLFLHDARDMLHERFGIAHVTIQIERDEDMSCPQAPIEAL